MNPPEVTLTLPVTRFLELAAPFIEPATPTQQPAIIAKDVPALQPLYESFIAQLFTDIAQRCAAYLHDRSQHYRTLHATWVEPQRQGLSDLQCLDDLRALANHWTISPIDAPWIEHVARAHGSASPQDLAYYALETATHPNAGQALLRHYREQLATILDFQVIISHPQMERLHTLQARTHLSETYVRDLVTTCQQVLSEETVHTTTLTLPVAALKDLQQLPRAAEWKRWDEEVLDAQRDARVFLRHFKLYVHRGYLAHVETILNEARHRWPPVDCLEHPLSALKEASPYCLETQGPLELLRQHLRFTLGDVVAEVMAARPRRAESPTA